MPHVLPLQADDPRRVGRYRLTGRLAGRDAAGGSTHRVFMARMAGGGMVVVTLLGNQRAAGPAARDRFTAEARVARRVAPFCAARILDAGIEGDDPYLVTEYVPGPTVAEAAGHDGPLPDPTLEALAIGTATGLAAIHQTGLVHGEFGPDRVVLGPDGPRVTHFGITPPYGASTPAADLLAWAQTVIFVFAAGRRLTLDQIIDRGRKNCANGVIMLAVGPPGPPGTVRFTFLRSRGSNPAGTLTRSH
jgi:serine/threonine protein kinase